MSLVKAFTFKNEMFPHAQASVMILDTYDDPDSPAGISRDEIYEIKALISGVRILSTFTTEIDHAYNVAKIATGSAIQRLYTECDLRDVPALTALVLAKGYEINYDEDKFKVTVEKQVTKIVRHFASEITSSFQPTEQSLLIMKHFAIREAFLKLYPQETN